MSHWRALVTQVETTRGCAKIYDMQSIPNIINHVKEGDKEQKTE